VTTDEWLEAHRVAHSVGLQSNVTIMFVTSRRRSTWRGTWCAPGAATGDGGFTEFVPLPFVHMATPISLQGRAREARRSGRCCSSTRSGGSAYRGWIDNIQISWVKVGIRGAQQALQAGCNDLGGTLMDENISRAAGASHGQELDDDGFAAIVDPLGRPLEQRTTLYGGPAPSGGPSDRTGPSRFRRVGRRAAP